MKPETQHYNPARPEFGVPKTAAAKPLAPPSALVTPLVGVCTHPHNDD
ncbi:MAG: hypothetical protein J7641_17435 [Cyanobacteria bacterium SID2]|nr:hypothetical protein [Cyanobacteria bacterium SID2]MBP0003742.1 hypothetical protein [Cyanobacteria bacterium SBC]